MVAAQLAIVSSAHAELAGNPESPINYARFGLGVALCLLVLIGLVVLRRFRPGMAGKPPQRRLQLVESLALGPRQRLHLLECDGQRFLLLAGMGGSAQLLPLDGKNQGAANELG